MLEETYWLYGPRRPDVAFATLATSLLTLAITEDGMTPDKDPLGSGSAFNGLKYR